MNNILYGERVYLVPISIKDTDNIIKWRNQPFVRNMFLRRELLTEQIHNNWLNKMIETNKAKQFIIYIKEDNRPIGSVFLKDINLKMQTAEYGNFIGERDCLGKGYGSDAGITLIKYAFEKLDMKKIYLRVLKENARAINAYKKIGFVKTGSEYNEEIKAEVIYMEVTCMNFIELK